MLSAKTDNNEPNIHNNAQWHLHTRSTTNWGTDTNTPKSDVPTCDAMSNRFSRKCSFHYCVKLLLYYIGLINVMFYHIASNSQKNNMKPL